MVQLSEPYVISGKTTPLTTWTFVGRVMSLLFSTLSRFAMAFLPRSNVFYSMAAVTIRNDLGAQEEEICHYFHTLAFCLPCSSGAGCHDLSFLIFILRLSLSLSSFSLIKRLFSSSSLSALRVVSSAHLRLLMPLPPMWISACHSSTPAFLMMCSVQGLNNQGDSRRPRRTPFSTLNQSVVPYRVLTVASWPTYRFLRSQVRWSGVLAYKAW